MILLSSDWHLDDQSQNEYRWQVFDKIEQCKARYPISHVFNLGDIVDRKDRFTGAFINRLLNQFNRISPISILRGNHDTTLHPPNYFNFLSEDFLRSRINYISSPFEFNEKLLLLPFSSKPREEWERFNFQSYVSVFMHATVTGAVTENGQVMENRSFPVLPTDVKFYSGDVHVPQTVRNIVYVGCPHPVKFGDKFPCRMLLLDENSFEIVEQIVLSPPRKLMLNIRSIDDLRRIRLRKGDQIKIRFSCDPSEIDNFGQIESEIALWAERGGGMIAGTEVIVRSTNRGVDINQTPEKILREFAVHEQLSDDLVNVGLELLRETS